jgi:hypothetical protein
LPRYKLRTLLILLAIEPPMLAGVWFYYVAYVERQRIAAEQLEIDTIITVLYDDSFYVPAQPNNGGLSWDVPYEEYDPAGTNSID